jgi:hypothetical protein
MENLDSMPLEAAGGLCFDKQCRDRVVLRICAVTFSFSLLSQEENHEQSLVPSQGLQLRHPIPDY